tara:strand:- start:269 stop:922 length:654 start_codon:yes stop_codon:yes gene_type:complete
MKLSNETREILKNYANINSNLLVNTGNKIATMSSMKNIVSIAELPDTFETEFAIYDLNEWLSAMSLFNDPELDFGENSVRMWEGNQSLKYFYSDPTVVTTPKSDITFPTSDATFTLTKDTFNKVLKAASVLNAPDMVLDTGDVGIMLLRVSDRKNDTSNNFSIEVGEGATPNQKFFFKVENLKLLSGDYEVEVSTKGISKFKNVSKNIEYFIALETA